MKFHGKGTITFTNNNTANGQTFTQPEFEAKPTKAFNEYQNAQIMLLKSMLRKAEKKFPGVEPEEITLELYEIKPPEPIKVEEPELIGQGSLF
jgi:N-acetyl-anhydromuramyl-L-alanine amidase AmpD